MSESSRLGILLQCSNCSDLEIHVTKALPPSVVYAHITAPLKIQDTAHHFMIQTNSGLRLRSKDFKTNNPIP